MAIELNQETADAMLQRIRTHPSGDGLAYLHHLDELEDYINSITVSEDEKKCKDCVHFSPGDYDIEVWCKLKNDAFENLFSCSEWEAPHTNKEGE